MRGSVVSVPRNFTDVKMIPGLFRNGSYSGRVTIEYLTSLKNTLDFH
jgi:hypothetical protein